MVMLFLVILGKQVDLKNEETQSEMYTEVNFILAAEIEDLDMHKLIRFCRDSKVAQKVSLPGFNNFISCVYSILMTVTGSDGGKQ